MIIKAAVGFTIQEADWGRCPAIATMPLVALSATVPVLPLVALVP
jgi:hypothetical protein